MQRKVYAPGVAALLAALLAGCTGSSGDGAGSADSKPGDAGSAAAPAEPGRYRTLPEPCGEVEPGTLDAMLPGIEELRDGEQREKAYEGTPTVTYDTDRRVGCRWKISSSDASHHLFVDFERVVSYDGTVSDDDRAAEVYATKLREADLPAPAASDSGSPDADEDAGTDADKNAGKNADKDTDKSADEKGDKAQGGKRGPSGPGDDPADDAAATTEPATPPAGLEPRSLDDLGDEAFLDDALTTAASATRHRTVTVVFRTSNVIVTIEYDEQPGRRTDVPDSKEMQDKALELADGLAGEFDE
ncbi:DUF3558 domain-containing protein [Streptomyces sp. G44]|uniref:DUF3558 domain-containing protein n=1 Tax=Streptomyces sp. G44 TaxID=2807632 RepID=UPI001960EBEA|nr:DUF3558 domain-containing protein [Streptomyces sp. G44]MBM7173610.1 DUF3558 domain-containing protein [Streptomyces sp. G44]